MVLENPLMIDRRALKFTLFFAVSIRTRYCYGEGRNLKVPEEFARFPNLRDRRGLFQSKNNLKVNVSFVSKNVQSF